MIKKALVASVAGVLLLLAQPSQAPAAESTAYQQLNLFGDVFELVRARYADGRMTEQSADAGRVRLTMPKGARALPTHIEWVPQLSNESGRKR